MTLQSLSTLIQTIVGTISGAVYLRATDADANVSIDNIELDGKTIVLFNNLPDITHTIARTGFIMQQIPVEIRVLQLAGLDDTTDGSDILRDRCADIANNIFDQITFSQELPDTFEYQISYLNEVKIYDKTMTGCRLSFVFNASRLNYSCQ